MCCSLSMSSSGNSGGKIMMMDDIGREGVQKGTKLYDVIDN